jgi:hypothetical protein
MNAVPFDNEPSAGTDLTTKSDLRRLETAVTSELGLARSDLAREIAAMRSELLNAMDLLRRDLTIRFGGMLVVAVGVLLAAMRFMPHP